MSNEIQEDPFVLFSKCYTEATEHELNDPDAMSLATVGADGMPSVRMVLLKAWDARGFVFYTNYESRKGRELLAHPKAALNFHWKSLRRQVRVQGAIETVTAAEADAYFATRKRHSQLGAWASDQSRPLESRAVFEARLAATAEKFEGGFRLLPDRIEFWHDREHRLHERVLYTRSGDDWMTGMLYP
jgi:pyridoxamine 5'-phosphate oxidase